MMISHLRALIPTPFPSAVQSKEITKATNSRVCLRGFAGAENWKMHLFEYVYVPFHTLT